MPRGGRAETCGPGEFRFCLQTTWVSTLVLEGSVVHAVMLWSDGSRWGRSSPRLDRMSRVACPRTFPQGPGFTWVGGKDLLHPLPKLRFQHVILRPEALVRMTPVMAKTDALDTGLGHFLEATEAGLNCRVDQSACNRYPKAGGREQRILFCVNADADVIAHARLVFRLCGG